MHSGVSVKALTKPRPAQTDPLPPIPTDVKTLNEQAHAAIQHFSPTSVWQYYQLINVTWPRRSLFLRPGPGASVPLDLTPYDFQSNGSNQPVSNVVMETYRQSEDCTSCHRKAEIAPSLQAQCTPTLAADFSFVFRHADTSDRYRTTFCMPGP
jgi:hypothetical protein